MDARTSLARRMMSMVAVLAAAGIASAHVTLDAPNGGEVLAGDTVAVIEWHVVIGHATNDWDLWYSVTGPAGPWVEIAVDLPPGDIFTGAIHTFNWRVPDLQSDQVRVRVRQDNTGTDYEDISDDDLMITATLFADGFESGTTGQWSIVAP